MAGLSRASSTIMIDSATSTIPLKRCCAPGMVVSGSVLPTTPKWVSTWKSFAHSAAFTST